jgi:hypothetical protein
LPWPPVRRHSLAAIESAIFFRCPCLVIAPRLKVGLGAARQVALPIIRKGGTGLIERVD